MLDAYEITYEIWSSTKYIEYHVGTKSCGPIHTVKHLHLLYLHFGFKGGGQ